METSQGEESLEFRRMTGENEGRMLIQHWELREEPFLLGPSLMEILKRRGAPIRGHFSPKILEHYEWTITRTWSGNIVFQWREKREASAA